MKAILEFNLPEEKDEFDLAVRGSDIHHTLWEMDQWLRGKIKYAADDIDENTYKTYEECREKLRQFANENKIDLN